MGLKGNLSTVNLADVFQMLSKGNSTGLLRIQAPEGSRFVEIQNGAISIAGRSTGRIMLGDLLVSRGLIEESQLAAALREQKETGKLLGQSLVESQLVSLKDLEAALRFQIEEEVCELFHLKRGEFDFLNAVTLDANIAPGGGMVRFKLDPNGLLLEAARQSDEWQKVSDKISSQSIVFKLTDEGRKLAESGEGVSPEALILMRLAQQYRSIETMVMKACLGRVATNSILIELWDAGLMEPAKVSEYPSFAKEHLVLGRGEEARRIATYVIEAGTEEDKQAARAVIKDVEKAAASTSGATQTGVTEKKRHTEVVKRAAINNQIMLKKQMPIWPIVAGVVLIGAGVGGYFAFFSESRSEAYSASRKSLDEILVKVQEDMANEKYVEALQKLKEFRSSDTNVQKLAREQLENREKDVESKLLRAIKKFDDAKTENNPANVKTAADELARFIDVSVGSPQVDAQRRRSQGLLEEYKNQQRIGELQAHLQMIEAEERPKGKEALIKAYQGVIAEDPPEEIAAPVREQLSALQLTLREGRRMLGRGEVLRKAGFFQGARYRFERVNTLCAGSALAVEAHAKLTELARNESEAQAQIDKITVMQTQRNVSAAVNAMAEFFEKEPPQDFIPRASNLLSSIATDPDLAKNLDAEGRKKIADLVEKFAPATQIKLDVASTPDGADVSQGFKPVGKTPLTLELPARRAVCLLLKKEGFQDTDSIDGCAASKGITVLMESVPSIRARMPRQAGGGMAIVGEKIVMAGGDELVLCSRQDLKVLKRVRSKEAFLPLSLSASQGQAFVSTKENFLVRFTLSSGDLKRISLEKPAASPGMMVNSPAGMELAGIMTSQGYENYDFKTLAIHRRVALPDGDDTTAQSAICDGEMVFAARKKSIYALNAESGEKKWSAETGAETAGLCVLNASLAVLDAGGKVNLFDREKGAKKLLRDLASPCSIGCLNCGNGLLVVAKSGQVDLLKTADGASAWTRKLEGEAILPAIVARNSENDPAKAIAIAVSVQSNWYVYALNPETGGILWRALFDSKPLALASDGKRIYVATDDADISVFEIK